MLITNIFNSRPRRYLSIDFGRAFVKIIHVESLQPGLKLLSYEIRDIAPNLERREKGIIDFINSFLKRRSIADNEAVLSISDADGLIIKHLVLPVLPEAEILEAIKWQLKEEMSFALEAAIWDWQLTREYSEEDGARKNGITVAAVKKEIINDYLTIIGNCGLKPLSITSGPLSYAKLLGAYPQPPPCSSVLDIGFKDASLSIYNNNKLSFMRRLSFSVQNLTQSLMGTLASDKGRVELSYEQAQDIRNTFGIPQDTNQTLRDNISATQVISLLRPHLEGLARELRASFDYFTKDFNTESPAILYITGGGANLKNLDRYLSKELNMRVSALQFPAAIDLRAIKKEEVEQARNLIMSALGAALTGPMVINLLPSEVRARKSEFLQKVYLRLITISVGAIFALLLFILRFQIHDYQNRLRNANIHLQAFGELKSIKQRIDLKEGLISKVQDDLIPAEGLLKLISTFIPREAILDELFLDQEKHYFVLKGKVSANEDIAQGILSRFILQLEKSHFLIKANLVSLRNTDSAENFEIRGELAR